MMTFILSGGKMKGLRHFLITKMKKPTQDGSIGYIIDFYNKYHTNDDVIKSFHLRDQNLCIRAITSFEWGQPIFPEKSIDDDYSMFHVYKTVEEAEKYLNILRRMDRGSF